MRIGIDYTAAVRQIAGIGRYTRGLVNALAKIDRINEYVLFTAGGKSSEEWPANFKCRSVPLSDRIFAIVWHRLRLPIWVEAFIGRVDVFHSPDFLIPPVRKAKTIVTVHDLSFIRLPECADANLRIYLEKAVPRSVERADLVLADSENTKDDLVELLGVPRSKVKVIYPGVDERFRPLKDELALNDVRKRYELPSRFILSLGTLEPRKNLTRLIEAFSLLSLLSPFPFPFSPLSLVIAGGKGWLYEDIFRKVEELGLGERVVFTGFVSDADLPVIYNLAELFVFPSLYEGFGLPVLEAMACGTPVVTSNSSSLPEVVGEAGLMVDPMDVEGLAEAMWRALSDHPLRERMIRSGMRRARGFTWEKSAEELLSLYKEL
jgi:glycosyltransferase involved in cell wall biosynthesis